MGVVYIGDRSVGKTHLAFELANPQGQYVKVCNLNYDNLKPIFLQPDGTARATSTIDNRTLDVQVQLSTGRSQVSVEWIDPPGEIFRVPWQLEHPSEWNSFLETVRQSEGILLVLPPYREILKPDVNPETYITQEQWSNRFDRWTKFFSYDCPKARHILICLNMADLFSDHLDKEAQTLAFNPYGTQLNWLQRHIYVRDRYFFFVQSHLEEINRIRGVSGLSVRCFITSIYNRTLLELPWIYLASYLGN